MVVSQMTVVHNTAQWLTHYEVRVTDLMMLIWNLNVEAESGRL